MLLGLTAISATRPEVTAGPILRNLRPLSDMSSFLLSAGEAGFDGFWAEATNMMNNRINDNVKFFMFEIFCPNKRESN